MTVNIEDNVGNHSIQFADVENMEVKNTYIELYASWANRPCMHVCVGNLYQYQIVKRQQTAYGNEKAL